jgi:7-keto-8-aminopelargonate synthetase-like enzyme
VNGNEKATIPEVFHHLMPCFASEQTSNWIFFFVTFLLSGSLLPFYFGLFLNSSISL